MNDRVFAPLFVIVAVSLGWIWRYTAERDWPTAPITVAAECALMLWLWHRLERKDRP